MFLCFLQFVLDSLANCHSLLRAGVYLFHSERSLSLFAYIHAGAGQLILVKDGGTSVV